MMTHLSLFSGIGGLDLAAEMAGFTTVGQCEWADYPTKVLEKHWPDVPRWRDIRTLTGESFYDRTGLRTVDVISGGFPCQPFSNAGKRKGQDDDRYLWPEMLRVIREIQPTWVIGENVPGIINLALDTVLSELGEAGYETQTFVVPACGVDAPHKRERVAILAYRVRERNGINGTSAYASAARETGNADGGRAEADDRRELRKDQSAVRRVADGLRTAIHEADPDADSNGLQGRIEDQIFPGGGYDGLLRSFLECTPLGRIGPMNPAWVEWLMGFPIGWTELSASGMRSCRSSSSPSSGQSDE